MVSREFAVTSEMSSGQQAWHRGGPGHGIRAARDQAAQGGGEEPGAVLDDGGGQHPGQEGPRGQRGAERPAAAVPEPVEQRPDQRRQQHERGHGEHEEEGDPAPGLVGGQCEDGAGERDGERGIRGDVDRVQLGEPGQAGVGRAVGVGEAAEPPPGRRTPAPDDPDAGPPATAHPAADVGDATTWGRRRRLGVRLRGSLVGGHDPPILPRTGPDPREGTRRVRPRRAFRRSRRARRRPRHLRPGPGRTAAG